MVVSTFNQKHLKQLHSLIKNNVYLNVISLTNELVFVLQETFFTKILLIPATCEPGFSMRILGSNLKSAVNLEGTYVFNQQNTNVKLELYFTPGKREYEMQWEINEVPKIYITDIRKRIVASRSANIKSLQIEDIVPLLKCCKDADINISIADSHAYIFNKNILVFKQLSDDNQNRLNLTKAAITELDKFNTTGALIEYENEMLLQKDNMILTVKKARLNDTLESIIPIEFITGQKCQVDFSLNLTTLLNALKNIPEKQIKDSATKVLYWDLINQTISLQIDNYNLNIKSNMLFEEEVDLTNKFRIHFDVLTLRTLASMLSTTIFNIKLYGYNIRLMDTEGKVIILNSTLEKGK